MQNQTAETVIKLDELKKLSGSPTFLHVLKFAERMEAKLEKNRHKGNREGWLNDDPWSLVERILDETVELQQHFTQGGDGVVVCDDYNKAADECADVANFCMMVADRLTTPENSLTYIHEDPSRDLRVENYLPKDA